MARGGLVSILILLLLIPFASATLTMNCPDSAQATHPFTISAYDSDANTIKIFAHELNEFPDSNYGQVSVTEPASMENQPATYYSYSYDSSGNLLGSTYCDVDILSANFPCAASVSPSVVPDAVVGVPFTVSVSADDDDGIHYLILGGQSASCYGYGGYPASCAKSFSLLYDNPGTYTLTASASDKWTNPCEQTDTLTITVTDPCEDYGCNDGNPCTTDRCVVDDQGNPGCDNDPVTDGQTCGGLNKCEGGICKAPCVDPNFCVSSQPDNSILVDQYYCTGAAQCFTCAAGYHADGDQCVPDTTCQNECTRDGAVGCNDTTHTQTCKDWDDDGCLEWGGIQACNAGEVCQDGVCVESCTDECTNNTQRCNGNTIQTCGYVNTGFGLDRNAGLDLTHFTVWWDLLSVC